VNRILGTIFIAAVAFLFYSNTLEHDFVLDDYSQIIKNEKVIISEIKYSEIFTSPVFPGNLYRPLLISSYKATYNLFGTDPYFFHFTNVSLHTIICLLILMFLSRLVGFTVAFWTTLLFALHPIHVEAVASISGRSELLCHLFGMLYLLFIVEEPKNNSSKNIFQKNFIGFGLLLCALLSKESGFSYLLLAPLAIHFAKNDQNETWRSFGIGSALAIIFYLFLRCNALGDLFAPGYIPNFLDNPLASIPIAPRLITAISLLTKYIGLILFPIELSSDYAFAKITPISSLENKDFWIAVLILLFGIFFSISKIKQRDLLSFVFLWFFGSALIISNLFFATGTIFAERLMYLPSLGICLFLVYLVNKSPFPRLSNTALLLLALAYGAKTFAYNQVWKNHDSLFTYEILNSPRSAKVQLNYSTLLRIKGDLDSAKIHIGNALTLYPNLADAWYGLALIANSEKDFPRARESLEKALVISPNHPLALYELGVYEFNAGYTDKADDLFLKILNDNPHSFYGKLGHMSALIRKGQIVEAQTLYQELWYREPGNKDLVSLKKQMKSEKIK